MNKPLCYSCAALMIFSMIGCKGKSDDSGAADGNRTPGRRVELVLASGGTGGTYFPLAGGMAKLWKDSIPGLNVTVQSTGASVANIRLLGKKEADLALVQNDVAEYGRTGLESFAERNEKYTDYLAMGALYPEVIQIVVRAADNIRTIPDLKGRKVIVGSAASGTELCSRIIFGAYGLSYKDNRDITPLFLGFSEGASALKDGSAQALVIVSGVPNASLADVQTVTDIRLLPVDLEKLGDRHRFFVPFTVKTGAYKGVDADTPGVALKAMLVVQEAVHPDLVYEMTKVLFEKAGGLGHGKAKEFDVNLALQGVTIPVHPGAARYYGEKGVTAQ